MNTSSNSNKSKLPEWQSTKMKSLIEDRWSEVWEAVVNRERLKHLQKESRKK